MSTPYAISGAARQAAPTTRRQLMTAAAGVAVGSMSGSAFAADAPPAAPPPAAPNGLPPARKGRIKQSLVSWCYLKHFGNSPEKLAEAARALGCVSIELIPPETWPTLKKYGLSCAIASSHGFVQGMNNPKYREKTLKVLTERIDQCAAAGVPSVISFTGMREDIPDDVGAKNCVEGYKQIIGHAEKN